MVCVVISWMLVEIFSILFCVQLVGCWWKYLVFVCGHMLDLLTCVYSFKLL